MSVVGFSLFHSCWAWMWSLFFVNEDNRAPGKEPFINNLYVFKVLRSLEKIRIDVVCLYSIGPWHGTIWHSSYSLSHASSHHPSRWRTNDKRVIYYHKSHTESIYQMKTFSLLLMFLLFHTRTGLQNCVNRTGNEWWIWVNVCVCAKIKCVNMSIIIVCSLKWKTFAIHIWWNKKNRSKFDSVFFSRPSSHTSHASHLHQRWWPPATLSYFVKYCSNNAKFSREIDFSVRLLGTKTSHFGPYMDGWSRCYLNN